MRPTRAANIDNHPIIPILDPKVLARLPDQPERRRIMHRQDRIPLLIRDFMDHAVPRISRIVNDDVDFSVAELCGFLDEDREVCWVGDVAGDGERAGSAGRGIVDCFGGGVRFGGVDVADYDLGAFVGEEAGAFCANALAGAGNLESLVDD